MDADTASLLGVALGALVLLGTVLARRTGVPEPVALVLVGLAASLLPEATSIDVPPDLVLLVFLPPLLFRASFLTSPRTLRANLTPLALLSVGLVVATAFAVAAAVALVVPGLSFAEGLVLGAVVGPTDPVAAAAVFSRLGAPRRVTDLVEGEALVNDATALVLLGVAVQTVTDGAPGLADASATIALAVLGGVAIGVVVARVVMVVRGWLGDDVGVQLLLSLLTPFLAYVPADHVHASGVLAVVTAGVVLGQGVDGVFSPATRLPGHAFWSLLELLLNAALFVLLGLQVRQVVGDIPDIGAGELALSSVVVVLVVLGLRLLWQVVVPPPIYWLRGRLGREQDRSSPSERFVVGWTGIRGAVSLAAALSVPLEVRGRPLILFLTVTVVLSTLLAQATTLPLVLRRLGLAGGDDLTGVEREARLALADVALARLDELEGHGDVPAGGVRPVRELWEHERQQVEPGEDPHVDLTQVRLEVARSQGHELDRLRREGLDPAVARALREQLDLQQARLGPE